MKTLKISCMAAVLALTACSGTEVKNTPASTGANATSTGDTPASATSVASPDPSSETSPSGESSSGNGSTETLTKSYGSTFTWDDKVAVTISKPQPFTPSEYAATDGKFKKFVVVDVTLKNGSTEPYNAMTLTTTATSGSQESDAVFDSEKGIDLPSADVLPGKELTWKQAYGVDDSGDLVIAVENGFGNAKGYYQ